MVTHTAQCAFGLLTPYALPRFFYRGKRKKSLRLKRFRFYHSVIATKFRLAYLTVLHVKHYKEVSTYLPLAQ
jgi:hypothetical protein